MYSKNISILLYCKDNLKLQEVANQFCSGKKISLVIESKLSTMLAKYELLQPQWLAIDMTSTHVGTDVLNMFAQMPDLISLVLLDKKENHKSIKLNGKYDFFNIENLPEELNLAQKKMLRNLKTQEHKHYTNSSLVALINDILLKCFIKKTNGAKYLSECLKINVSSGCKTKVMSNLYDIVASLYKTKSANVERAMRNCINTAQKRVLQKQTALEPFYSIFEKKPSNKMFVLFLSNYISSLLKKETSIFI